MADTRKKTPKPDETSTLPMAGRVIVLPSGKTRPASMAENAKARGTVLASTAKPVTPKKEEADT
ncbi:MAG: hypothetical protein AAFO77_10125 [Pseudomonadota bacterium]